ncbi:hypothetical protein D9613_010212 [Agrocybe pediades]|uniref:Uncharacterized protein n=1 Tax=Agrocybe pediades TaxID=84607 RepID=A0A8H4VHH4_9AGAR|nr:hypothetical protein D9613_010212 [Agrocybe pediades]
MYSGTIGLVNGDEGCKLEVGTKSLLQAIVDFNSALGNTQTSFEFSLIANYVQTVTQIVSGLAPTLMIAQLIVSSGQEDTEVSSVRLPSELISPATHLAGTNMTNVEVDLEMQQNRFIGVGKDESEEIQTLPRNEYPSHGQSEDELF